MSTSDLKSHATSTVDFYALLFLSPNFTQKDLDRSWRKAALKYHPDKNPGNATAVEKFHLANIAYDVFSDPSLRALYDAARESREKKRKADALMEERRRKLKQDLEGREKGLGVKRTWAEVGGVAALDEEARLEAEIIRIAEDGKRRRLEREDMLRREIEREGQEKEIASKEMAAAEERIKTQAVEGATELDRSVRARFRREEGINGIDQDKLRRLFNTFGPVESTFLMRDKRERVSGSKEKIVVGRGVIVFKSIVGAHAAIEDWAKEKTQSLASETTWTAFEDVTWASGKEPDCLASTRLPVTDHQAQAALATSSDANNGVANGSLTSKPRQVPSTPKRNFHEFLCTPQKTRSAAADSSPRLRKVPSFASFSAKAKDTPHISPKSNGLDPGCSPSLEELTMIRLRNAEKRRLEAERSAKDEG